MELKMVVECEVICLYTHDGYKLSTKALTHLIDYKWRLEQAFEARFQATMNDVTDDAKVLEKILNKKGSK